MSKDDINDQRETRNNSIRPMQGWDKVGDIVVPLFILGKNLLFSFLAFLAFHLVAQKLLLWIFGIDILLDVRYEWLLYGLFIPSLWFGIKIFKWLSK